MHSLIWYSYRHSSCTPCRPRLAIGGDQCWPLPAYVKRSPLQAIDEFLHNLVVAPVDLLRYPKTSQLWCAHCREMVEVGEGLPVASPMTLRQNAVAITMEAGDWERAGLAWAETPADLLDSGPGGDPTSLIATEHE